VVLFLTEQNPVGDIPLPEISAVSVCACCRHSQVIQQSARYRATGQAPGHAFVLFAPGKDVRPGEGRLPSGFQAGPFDLLARNKAAPVSLATRKGVPWPLRELSAASVDRPVYPP
jgi:hypothetical protein